MRVCVAREVVFRDMRPSSEICIPEQKTVYRDRKRYLPVLIVQELISFHLPLTGGESTGVPFYDFPEVFWTVLRPKTVYRGHQTVFPSWVLRLGELLYSSFLYTVNWRGTHRCIVFFCLSRGIAGSFGLV